MNRSIPISIRGSALTIAVLWTVLTRLAFAPTDIFAADTQTSQETNAQKAAPAPAAIPLAQLAAEADAATIGLRRMMAEASAQKAIDAIENELPALAREVQVRAREHKGILAQTPSLELLRGLDTRWRALRARLLAVEERLQQLITGLDQQLQQLDTIAETWSATAAAAAEEKAPAELVRRSTTVRAEVARAQRHVETLRTQALKLQTRVSDLEFAVSESLEANRVARDVTVTRMFARDSPPLWDSQWRKLAAARMTSGMAEALETHGVLLRDYLRPHAARVTAHALLLAALVGLFFLARKRLSALVIQDPALRQAADVAENPIASALVVALMLNHWIYPQAPRLLWAITGLAVLAPTILMLRRLVDRQLLMPLYAVLMFYLVDQVRAVSAAIDLAPRLLFVIEMIAAAALLVGYAYKRSKRSVGIARTAPFSALSIAAMSGAIVCAATGLANAAGYVALSNLVGDAVLESMYAGLVLFAVVLILAALVEIAMRMPPLTSLNMVRAHGATLERRTRRILRWAALGVWIYYVLDLLTVRERLIETLHGLLNADVSIGKIDISLSTVLSFILAVWAAFLVSRVVRFILNEEVFPHASLKRGVPYAISRTIHFAIIAAGFFIAMGIIGMQMTQFAILASAFTIGVGFGLQNIFNNFVSGLIVLFERPVQVGDVIQVDDAVGVVERIGIRASVVSTVSGSQVIVPNGKLISDRVVNWTLSGRKRVIELAISVVLQSDPEKVIAILEDVASRHPAVLKDPPAQAIVTRLGPDWMGFELRAAIGEVEAWMKIRSELAIAATAALRAAGVTMR